MQLSCFICLLLFQVRVHLRWQSFVGEKRRLLCWGRARCHRVCLSALSLPSLRAKAALQLPCAALACSTSQWLLKDPSRDQTGICLRTFLSFPPLEMHLVFSCHCRHTVARCPEQLVLAIYWAEGMPICGTSTVRSTVWQRTQGCEVCALLSSCISLWQVSELEFQIFCTYGCICYI